MAVGFEDGGVGGEGESSENVKRRYVEGGLVYGGRSGASSGGGGGSCGHSGRLHSSGATRGSSAAASLRKLSCFDRTLHGGGSKTRQQQSSGSHAVEDTQTNNQSHQHSLHCTAMHYCIRV